MECRFWQITKNYIQEGSDASAVRLTKDIEKTIAEYLRLQKQIYDEIQKHWDIFVRSTSGEIRNILDDETFPAFESLYFQYVRHTETGVTGEIVERETLRPLKDKTVILANPQKWIQEVSLLLNSMPKMGVFIQYRNTISPSPRTLSRIQRLHYL